MKKYLFILAAALIAFAACEKAETEAPAPMPEKDGLITADMEETATKVYLYWNGTIYRVNWEEGDDISLFRGNGNNLLYHLYDGAWTTSATFAPDSSNVVSSAQEFDFDVAVYPYQEATAVTPDGDKVRITTTLQDSFNGGFSFPMVAVNRKDASSNFAFKNVLGGLNVNVSGYAEITSVEFSGNNGEIIAGQAAITAGPGILPSVEMGAGGSARIVQEGPFTLSGEYSGSFTFLLPPMTFGKGVTITLTDSRGNKWSKTSETPLTIERSVMAYTNLEYPYVDEEMMMDAVYTSLGAPDQIYSTPDDFGFIMTALCNDLEGPDAYIPDSGYNWFSVCGEYSSRKATYRNPAIRYRHPVNLITKVNTPLPYFSGDNVTATAQLRTLRAFAYMQLVQDYQFPCSVDPSAPAVPILPEDGETTDVARSSVAEVYEYIKADLNYACEALAGYARPSKKYIDRQVALGLRARAGLLTGDYQAAYADAVAAAEGYSPASIGEVSKPSFMDISEHNWLWGYDMTPEIASANPYATSSSWLRSFSAWSYSAACQVYTCINSLLYDKIADTDVRKGWWVDENLESPLLEGLTWNGNGDVATYVDDDKTEFLPYANVKFGCNPVATTENAEDFPFMRVEEMILIQAEAAARLGNEAQARQILSSFVMGYRQPDYTTTASGEALLDEIWRQRRIELWGEGFGVLDVRRLGKPLVRFHGEGTSSQPYSYAFNMEADDGWLLMRFPSLALNANPSLVQNDGGSQPVPGQNPDLRDGVTD